MDVVELAADLALWDAENGAVEVVVFAPGEVSHQPGTHFDRRRYLAFDGDAAAGWF